MHSSYRNDGLVQGIHPNAPRWMLGASVLAAAMTMATSAEAQESTANEAAAVPEIIVTAQFREQRLQDTPLAITAVGSEMLEARSQTSLVEVANQTPSVALRTDTAINGPSIIASIRGLGQIDPNPALEPGVGIYIDDVYYPRMIGANLDLLDVERVEVLRGPQGTLTGRNSEGGAIRFVSKRPDGDGGGTLSATYGIRNRISMRGAGEFALAEKLFGRISGAFSSQDGYVKQIDYGCTHPGSGVVPTRPAGDCTISKWGNVNYQAVKGILRWNPTNSIDAMISADYVRDKRNNPAEVLIYATNLDTNVAPAVGVPYDNRFVCGQFCNFAANTQPSAVYTSPFFPIPPYPLKGSAITNGIDYKGGGVSGNLKVGLSDALELTSITAYREFVSDSSSDIDLSPANVSMSRLKLDTKFFSQEVRLNAKIDDIFDLTVGGYYSHERSNNLADQDVRAAGFHFIEKDKSIATSKALFATAIAHPTDGLTVTAGMRYTKETKDFTYGKYDTDGVTPNPVADPLGLLTGKTVKYRGDRWDYRVSVDYRFSPQVLAYATVSTGFKGGGVNPRPFFASQALSFNPETLTAFEVGLKTDLLDRRLRLNLAGYFNKFKNAQLQLTSCPDGSFPCALPANAGDADVKGLEAEVLFRPIEGLQIDASGSLLWWDWKCVKPQVLGIASNGQCSTDPALLRRLSAPTAGVAKDQWAIGLQYEIALASSGSLTPRIDVNHQGGVSSSGLAPLAGSPSDQFSRVASYTLTNARLTWRNAAKDLDVAIEVTNLFDKYYYNYKFDGIPFFYGNINASVGRPREWAVTVKKAF